MDLVTLQDLPDAAGSEQPPSTSLLASNPRLLEPVTTTRSTTIFASGNSRVIGGGVHFNSSINTVNVNNYTTVPDNDVCRRVVDWIDPDNKSAKERSRIQNLVFRDYMSGTGLWFLHGPKFQEWQEKPGSFVWLHGAGMWPFCSIQ
jgi:hypothetical protein